MLIESGPLARLSTVNAATPIQAANGNRCPSALAHPLDTSQLRLTRFAEPGRPSTRAQARLSQQPGTHQSTPHLGVAAHPAVDEEHRPAAMLDLAPPLSHRVQQRQVSPTQNLGQSAGHHKLLFSECP